MPPGTTGNQETQDARRGRPERRTSILRALWQGSFARRRHGPRRQTDRHPVMTDWFRPHWLAVVMLILILSGTDAVLTLALIQRGAEEINPLMAPLVHGSAHGFALWKLGLTSLGVVILTMLARLRILGGIAVGSILYVVLGIYLALVGYEINLLRTIPHY
jgi:Domain of unknown function (DUF5658)